MEEGFLMHKGHRELAGTVWVAGPLKVQRFLGVADVKGRAQIATVVYRCPKCGYLETYAPRVS